VELRVAIWAIIYTRYGEVRLQAVVTKDMLAASMHWQNRDLVAVGALGRYGHHWKHAALHALTHTSSSPQSYYRMLQIMKIYHGYADGKKLH